MHRTAALSRAQISPLADWQVNECRRARCGLRAPFATLERARFRCAICPGHRLRALSIKRAHLRDGKACARKRAAQGALEGRNGKTGITLARSSHSRRASSLTTPDAPLASDRTESRANRLALRNACVRMCLTSEDGEEGEEEKEEGEEEGRNAKLVSEIKTALTLAPSLALGSPNRRSWCAAWAPGLGRNYY